MNSDYQALKQQAEQLRKQNQFYEAIAYYEQLWSMTSTERDKWVGWGYAHCLRKVGRSVDALEICREVYKIDDQLDHNNNLYGWCVYDTGIKQPTSDFDESRFIKAAEAIVQLTTQGDYSPYERAVFAVVHHYEGYKDSARPILHDEIIVWLDKLDPETLSRMANKGKDGKSYPSPREDWYTSRAKALAGLGRHEECIEVCTHALEVFHQLHYGYDVWFRKSRAESLLALGRGAESLSDFEYMMKHKPDAWIRHKYAQALRSAGRVDDAISFAAEAALPANGLGFRWEVYLDLGEMLVETGQEELARKHVLLAAAIRQQEGWEKIPENLQVSLKQMNLATESLPDVNSLHQELQPFWKSIKPRQVTTHTGVIDLLHANGKSGVIEGDDGERYFFGMRNFKSNRKAAARMRVGFNLQKTINRKTGGSEMHAVDIREV